MGDHIQRWSYAHTIWARTDETVEWIADATNTQLQGLSPLVGVHGWRQPEAPWPSDVGSQRAHVAASTIRIEDREYPENGYSLWITPPEGGSPRLLIESGARHLDPRYPNHTATITFKGTERTLPSVDVIENVVLLSARAWRPLVVCDDSEIARLHVPTRSGWEIPTGYRLWISDDVGRLDQLADGLTTQAVEGGTLLSVPAHWEPERMYESVLATLEANGLDEIPH